jgi:hypothetical protein
MLTKTDLDTALSYYPHIVEQIKKVAGNRANLVKKRSQIAAKAAAEGKSAADAAKAAAQGTKDEDDEEEKEKEKEKEKPAAAPAPPSTSAPPAAKPAPVQSVSKEKEIEQGQKIIITIIQCLQAVLLSFSINIPIFFSILHAFSVFYKKLHICCMH